MPGEFHDRYAGYPHQWGGPSPLWAVIGTALFWLLPWLILSALLAWTFFRMSAAPRPVSAFQPVRMSALDVVREQYVMGNIDFATFTETLELLLVSESRGYLAGPQYV